MRILAAVLIVLVSATSVMAQPAGMNSSVIVTVVTGSDGTSDNLQLTLSGTFPGDPYSVILDQPGDLQPGTSNSYNVVVPHTMCEMFQFELRLDGSDSWLGTEVSITIDSVEMWFNSAFDDGSALTDTTWRGGTWDGTDAYRSFCSMTPVEVSFVTGANGTADNPFFYLTGDFSASPYRYFVNQPSDLQPNQTDTYEFLVPMDFCQMTGWTIDKPTTAGIDDDWLANEIDITVDGDQVFFDAVFSEVGPIVSGSNTGGTWDGTEAYQNRCSDVAIDPGVIVIPGLEMTPIIVPPGGLQLITPVITPEVIDPQIIVQPLASATPTSAGVSQCSGALPSRLTVGGEGRVTPGAPNRLRAQPTTSAGILGNIPAGGMFAVIGGPTCADGYAWWQVNYNGLVGWTAEGSSSQYWLEPA